MSSLTQQFPTATIIREAHARIAPYIHHTPVLRCSTIDRMLNTSIWFKCENLQKVGAFKARGATNAVLQLPSPQRNTGVATHSSGNHAQALSWAAALSGIPAHIVMPINSNHLKISAVRDYGGSITFCEPTLESRESTLQTLLQQTGATEIHPYNNYQIIAGQATAALELMEECGPFDLIIAPVGGGGLLAGTALAAHYFSPETKVIAAEPVNADDAFRSFRAKSFFPSVNPDTIADGLRTSLGSLTFPIMLDHVSEIYTTTEHTILEAMKVIWERMKIIVEPSAAVPLAIIMEHRELFEQKRIGIILSGGNADIYHLPWEN